MNSEETKQWLKEHLSPYYNAGGNDENYPWEDVKFLRDEELQELIEQKDTLNIQMVLTWKDWNELIELLSV